jgi:hypothetical protein
VRPGSQVNSGGKLFFVSDSGSGSKFLVDTGSSYSILPHHSSARPNGPALGSANNVRIRRWRQQQSSHTLGGQSFQFPFLLADVRFPIIGIDFLQRFQLVVDVCAEQLLPRSALAQSVAGDVFATNAWSEILLEFPPVTQPFTVASSPSPEHLIETTGCPLSVAGPSQARRRQAGIPKDAGGWCDSQIIKQLVHIVHWYTWSGRSAAAGGHAATTAA